MYIPKTMKKQIAKYFYDKEILVMKKNISRDAEGGLHTKAERVSYKFYGNVSFSNFGRIQEDYGLDYNIDISITASPETFDAELVYERDKIYIKNTNEIILELNDIISYIGKEYKVTNIIPTDSHILVLGKWER